METEYLGNAYTTQSSNDLSIYFYSYASIGAQSFYNSIG